MLQTLIPTLRGTRRVLAVVVATGALCAAPAHAADLTAYTEEWPPYNYSEGDIVKGISTDVLRALCETAKLDCDIRMVPWARAYRTASTQANTVVYTTARKPSREHEFLWVGPILPRTTWVYARQGLEQNIHDMTELAQHSIGVVRDEAAQQDLVAAGVPESALVVQASNTDVLRMMLGSSVDAMVDTEVGMQWNLRKVNVSPSAVSKLMKLSDEGAYYFALNLDSDPILVRKLQSAMDKLRHEGKLDAIVRKYGAGTPTMPARKLAKR
jgi:polar amino acid transport system substrate-binding protein